ncbi:hypothetical protein [Streptomyces sp. SID3343]|uniref:hypothetical protein n=1 Tax=Streptomyces sp. SID3343 TaxID=2690260 RepID=UPI00136C5351|nr:hypothetical protein [Streptomyces sp. SID3343]
MFDTVPSEVRRIGTIVRRGVLLFPVPPALIVGIAGAWNPWNVDVLERGLTAGGIAPLVVAGALIGIELSLTFHSLLIRLVTLAFVCLGGLLVALTLFVFGLVEAHQASGKTVAVSPDGRVRAVVVQRENTYTIDSTYSLRVHLDAGFDRSTTILAGCTDEGGGPPLVRFLDNRTLEYTGAKGPTLRVQFDKNLNTTDAGLCP